MATINFYLDKPDKKGKCHIFLVYQMNGKKFKISTQEKIEKKYWNGKKQEVKYIADAYEINQELDRVKSKLKRVLRKLKDEEGNYDIIDVKKAYQVNAKPKKKIKIFDYFDIFLKQKAASNQRKTLQEYTTIINDLKEYETFYNERLSFERLDEDFLSKFLQFLYEEKENVINTVAKKVSTLKTMLRAASKARVSKGSNVRINTTMDFLDFKVSKIKTSKIFLTKSEVLSMYHLNLSHDKRLECIRDKFCFACFTGMRFSDLNSFKEEWIKSSIDENSSLQALQYKDQKTNSNIFIPLHPLALKIINKYRFTEREEKREEEGQLIFSKISSQKYNDYIKIIGELAGIDESIALVKYIGKKRVDSVKKKYELLSSHAARRTFITLSMMQGMKLEVVQKIVGHKSIKTTLGYATILDEWKQREMLSAWEDFEK